MGRLFDSTGSEYLTAGRSPIGGLPLTIMCWFKRTTTGDIMVEAGSGGQRFRLFITGGGEVVYQVKASSTTNIPTTTASSANKWHHACGVSHSATDHRVFLDGGGKATSSASRDPATPTNMWIGEGNPDTNPWDGALAEVAVYRGGLSDSEIIYAAGNRSPLFVRPTDLVLYAILKANEDFDIIGGVQFTTNGTPEVGDHPNIAYPSGFEVRSIGRSVIDPLQVTEHRRRRLLGAAIGAGPAGGGNILRSGVLGSRIITSAKRVA